MNSLWNWPGSRWWKFDPHSHTPASKDWAQKQSGMSPEDWLLHYMRAEVDCVAVTDHNNGAWIDRLKSAYERMRREPPVGFRELWLFPGVEISVNGGFHLLAVFDCSTSSSDLDTLLGKVDYAGTKGDSDGVTRKSATEVIEAIISAGGLPIPAHADSLKGLLQLKAGGNASPHLDANTVRQILQLEGVLAMEVVDASVPKPEVYREQSCKWTEVIGSDWHGGAGETAPGARFTWVKMSHPPSLEGLRLALLDGARFSVQRNEESPAFDPLRVPEHFIEEVTVSDARYMGRGQPEKLNFSPWFNALVGGRGTGKSTVVHGLRLAYRRDDDLARLGAETDARRVFEAFRRVPKTRGDPGGLQATTEILVTVSRAGVLHRLRWRQDAGGLVVEDSQGASWAASTSQSVTPERFPIRIFSQGQIAALAGESQDALLGLLDEDAPTRDAKRALDDSSQRFLALRAQTREIDAKLKGRDEATVKLADVKRKLTGFEGKEHTEILRDYQRRSRQEREFTRQFERGHALANQIDELGRQLVAEDPPPGLFSDEDAAEGSALAVLNRLRDTVAQAAAEVRAAGDTLRGSLSTAHEEAERSAWRVSVVESTARYAALTTELQAQGVADPGEYGKLVQERHRLEGEIERLESLGKERDKLAADAAEQRKRVRRARQEVSGARRSFLEGALAKNAYVRISLVPYGRDARTTEQALRHTLAVNDDRFGEDILVVENDEPGKGLVGDLLRHLPGDPPAAAAAIEDRLDELSRRFERAAGGHPEFGGHFNNYLQRACVKQPELLDRLLLFAPEDGLAVEYSQKGDGTNFRPINQASAGQRAAAMVAFLLAHGTEPIVLDQPEDDLDNHLIYDLVVRQIREHKMHRQLIVVTHNPNIVVNGDAEMLHALDFRRGQCRVVERGALQERTMREEVCRVMEGGREAFERRYLRLGRSG